MIKDNLSNLIKPHQYIDLQRFNLLVYVVMLCSLVLTVVGLVHGVFTLTVISEAEPTQLLSALPLSTQALIAFDDQIRPIQIASIALVLVTVFWLWLYYARRNSYLFHQNIEEHRRYFVKEAMRLSVGIFFTIGMMTQLVRSSAAKVRSDKNLRPLVLIWWVVFIAANLSKLTSLYLMYQVQTLAMWRMGHAWIMLAYVLYLLLYILTCIFIRHVTLLQRSQLALV